MKAATLTSTSIRSAGFWAEIKPTDHIVQCWGHEESLLEALEGYVAAGLRANEGVAIICTASHIHELEKRFRKHWLDIDRARWEGRYIPLLAQEVLAKLMGDDGMPDAARFRAAITPVLDRARGPQGRQVRLFGEMVSLLWAQGNAPATIQLENLWGAFLREHRVPLFCAYDRLLFMDNPDAMKGICGLHTLLLPG